MIEIRDALPSDTKELNRLALESPSLGDVKISSLRPGNYLTFSEALGKKNRVFVATQMSTGKIVGTISVSLELLYRRGKPRNTAYFYDLKIDSKVRGAGIGFLLMKKCADQARDWSKEMDEPIPLMMAVAADNHIMRSRMVPALKVKCGIDFRESQRFHYFYCGTSRRRKASPSGFNFRDAKPEDLLEMHQLWIKAQSKLSLGRVMSTEEWSKWIERTPGVSIESYTLIFKEKELVGFSGIWDQRSIRELIVIDSPAYFKILERFLGPLLRFLGTPPLPRPLLEIDIAYQIHRCIPDENPEIFSLLLAESLRKSKDKGVKILATGIAEKSRFLPYARKWSFSSSDALIYWDRMGIEPPEDFQDSQCQVEAGFG